MTVKEQLEDDFADVEFPATCRCGFEANEPADMVAHAAVEHLEVFQDE